MDQQLDVGKDTDTHSNGRFPTWERLQGSDRIVLAASGTVLGLVIAFFSFFANNDRIASVIKTTGLGALMLCLGVTIYSGYRLARQRSVNYSIVGSVLRAVRTYPWLFVLWFGCAILAVSIFPRGNRVLMDEIVVLCTSRAIHEEREPITPSLIDAQNEIHKLSGGYIDKRPFLFATIVAIFHDLLGYSPENAFYANMMLAALTLAIVGVLGVHLGGSVQSGAVAMIALASVPIFCQHATGGGIDLLNVCSISLVLWMAILHVEDPSRWSTLALLGSGALLAYSRYESVTFVCLPFGAMLLVWRRTGRLFLSWPVLLFWPAVVPLLGIHYLTFSSPAEWFQFSDHGVNEVFSFGFFFENLMHALVFFLDLEHLHTNSPIVFVLGSISLLLLAVASWRWRREPGRGLGLPFWIFAGVTLLNFALLMSYNWGTLDDLVASRLSLPAFLLLVLSISAVAREIRSTRHYMLCGGAIFAAAIYWSSFPLAAKNYATKLYASAQTLSILDEFNRRQPDRRFLVLNSITTFWVTRDVFAIPPRSAKKSAAFLAELLKSQQYRRVYLIQVSKKEKKTGRFIVDPSDNIDLPLNTDLVSEDLVAGERKVRVSLVNPSSVAAIEALLNSVDKKAANTDSTKGKEGGLGTKART